jgi:hypothetical protein
MRRIEHSQRDSKRCAQADEEGELLGLRPACEFLPEVLRLESPLHNMKSTPSGRRDAKKKANNE